MFTEAAQVPFVEPFDREGAVRVDGERQPNVAGIGKPARQPAVRQEDEAARLEELGVSP
jgi:hypothetical protein